MDKDVSENTGGSLGQNQAGDGGYPMAEVNLYRPLQSSVFVDFLVNKPMLPTGVKADTGKAPVVYGALHYFPRAIEAVAALSAYGAKKYSLRYDERNFAFVDNGIQRYTDALGRHLGREIIDQRGIDPESNFMHAVHVAWNALARLELMLDEQAKQESK